MEHTIQEASLQRFAAGTASGAEARAITRHLLRGCPLCAGRLRDILRPPVWEADYDSVLDAFARICPGLPKEREEPGSLAVPIPFRRKQPEVRPWH